jgi:hypothetical protein
MRETLTDNRPTWTILIQTGDPKLTHTEWAYSLAQVNEMILYYGLNRLLIFGPDGFEL